MKKPTLCQKNMVLLLPVLLGIILLTASLFGFLGYMSYRAHLTDQVAQLGQSIAAALQYDELDDPYGPGQALPEKLRDIAAATGCKEIGLVFAQGDSVTSNGVFAAGGNPGWTSLAPTESGGTQARYLGGGVFLFHSLSPVRLQQEQAGWVYVVKEADVFGGFLLHYQALLSQYGVWVLLAVAASIGLMLCYRAQIIRTIQQPLKTVLESVRALAEGIEDGGRFKECSVAEIDTLNQLMCKTTRQMQEIANANLSYRKSIDSLNTIVYEYRIDTGEFKILAGETTPFTGGPNPKSFKEAVRQLLGAVHPQDRCKVRQAFGWGTGGAVVLGGFAELEYRLLTHEGEQRWAKGFQTFHKNAQGEPIAVVGSITDITEQKLALKRLEKLAQRDSLTKLYNKENFERRVSEYLEQEGAGGLHALVVLDIDDFKQINDTHGHSTGDRILDEFSKMVKECYRRGGLCGRIGGDEFAVLMKDILTMSEELDDFVNGFIRNVSAAIEVYEGQQLSVSAGVAVYPWHGQDYATLFDEADAALYRAKALGKQRCCCNRLELPELARG